jgi:hypothetical protein
LIKNSQPVSFQLIFLITLLCLPALMLSGCTVHQPAISKYQTNFNFSKVSSYAFYKRNSEFGQFQNISYTTRNSIELAIEQVLDKNGFIYNTLDDADIVVTYHLVNENTKELLTYNNGVLYCSLCLRGGEAQADKKQWQTKPGSLIIDVLDPEKKRSVWRSVYPLKINVKTDNSREVQLKIYQAIDAMIDKYPHSRDASKANNA